MNKIVGISKVVNKPVNCKRCVHYSSNGTCNLFKYKVGMENPWAFAEEKTNSILFCRINNDLCGPTGKFFKLN